ncbi:hypothetical protein GOP47_0025391 [Adiantum capillus-veneris]|uniref:Uncharacterized protein n=1 Tax=Adiantum capillus-veneris TaxID=13818 RepID=A0A9D4U0N8_ADICA|nr:hypothetical protein GOP47_0025391 [Adiantum capillus-veneris]
MQLVCLFAPNSELVKPWFAKLYNRAKVGKVIKFIGQSLSDIRKETLLPVWLVATWRRLGGGCRDTLERGKTGLIRPRSLISLW